MQAALLQSKTNRKSLLYPLLIIAALSVIIFSAIGAAALTGWLPKANSANEAPPVVPYQKQDPVQYEKRSAVSGFERIAAKRRAASVCVDCGVVTSIVPVEVKGKTNGLGMIAGGVAGALVGNQIGSGNGNAVATVGGAAGGAYAGNEVEKRVKKSVRYKVRVRMPDGTYRTTYEPNAHLAVGDKVKIENGRAAKIG